MAAIADAIIAAVAFIFEALLWSFVGFWRLCRAVFSQRGRAEVAERWMRGTKERLAMIGAFALWVPVFTIGFGLGLPLGYRLITESSQKNNRSDIRLTGEAVIVVPHPKHSEIETVVRIDRSRLSEISDTKDLADLAKKLREISVIEERKKPNKAPEPTP